MYSKYLITALLIFLGIFKGFSQNAETRSVDDFTKIDVWGNIK